MSIKEEARLSLVAGPGKEHPDSTFIAEAATAARPIRLLRSAAIYGANAAGKTNVVLALKTMYDIVLGAARDLAELPVTPFRFDPASSAEPTTFEVTCIADHVRYQYGFRTTRNEVTDEWLYAWPSGRAQVWFERRRGEVAGQSSWKLGGKLTGDREVWKRATGPQAFVPVKGGLSQQHATTSGLRLVPHTAPILRRWRLEARLLGGLLAQARRSRHNRLSGGGRSCDRGHTGCRDGNIS